MSAEIKFCGLTRVEDAGRAVALGASYVGVIFAGGPRSLDVEQAAAVFADVPHGVRRVGVFADQTPAEIGRMAARLSLAVVQLHGAPSAARVAEVRRHFGGAIWPVLRVRNGVLPESTPELYAAGDGLLLDAFVDGALGGTGHTLPWISMAVSVRALRAGGSTPIILAGGLRPENVAAAIAALSPDVVDVSSGVECAAGIKDHERMLAFRDAVAQVAQFAQASILT